MNFTKLFGFLIICMIATSLVSGTLFDSNSFKFNGENAINDVVSPLNTNNSVNGEELNSTMNYTQMLNYLLNTPENKQPNYILCNGFGSNLTEYSFSISYGPVDNYHNINNNYHNISLTDDIWKGTLFYTPDNYKLSTKFVINNNDSIDLVNWALFQQDIKYTQYWQVAPIADEFPQFPYTDDELAKMFNSTDPIALNNHVSEILAWIDLAHNILTKQIESFTTQASQVDMQNTRLDLIRGEKSGHYWSPDTYAGYYEEIDDPSLKLINMYDQGMKIPLDKIRNSLDGVSLNLDNAENEINIANANIPFDFGMDKPLKFLALFIKTINLYIKNMNYNRVQQIYHQLDQDTMRISGEKDYRSLVFDGYLTPHDPTPDEIMEQNKRIDDKITILKNFRTSEHDRIYDPNYLDNMRNNILDNIHYLEDIIDNLRKYGGSATLISILQGQLDADRKMYNNVDFMRSIGDGEKVLYGHYSVCVDEQIDTLNDMRWGG
jgi:hypothetical protein